MAHFPDLINYRWACTRWKFKNKIPGHECWAPCACAHQRENLQHKSRLIGNMANENQWHMTYSYSTQFHAYHPTSPSQLRITSPKDNLTNFQFHSIWPYCNKQVSPWPSEDPLVVLQTSRRMYIFKEHSEHSCKLKGKQNIEAPPPNNTSHMGNLLHCCTLYLSTTQGHQ